MRYFVAAIMLALIAVTASWGFDPGETIREVTTASSSYSTVATSVNEQPTEVVVEGKTQLYVNWARPLTAVESAFLVTAPQGCDADGQSYRKVVEVCFRGGIAHAESAPYYGYVDRRGTCYDYSYYCRLLQPADAPHTFRVRVPMPAPICLPPLGAPQEVTPPQPIQLEAVCLDLKSVGVAACVQPPSLAPSCATVPAGAFVFGTPGSHQERTIGGIAGGGVSNQPCEQPQPGGCKDVGSKPTNPPAGAA